jgi:hypothetical protein
MNRNDQAKARPTLWFLADSEIAAREMVELAVANCMATRRFGVDDHERGDLAILADQLLDDARKAEECWTTGNKCAASAWGM